MNSRNMRRVADFLYRDDGNSGTEYAVMLSLIVIIAFSGYFAMGDKITAIFQRVTEIG